MKTRVTLTDKENGVSAIVTDTHDGTPPEVLLRNDTANCTLDVPHAHPAYTTLLALSKNLNAANVTGPALSYTRTEMTTSSSAALGFVASVVSFPTSRGETAGSLAAFAKPIKEQCPTSR